MSTAALLLIYVCECVHTRCHDALTKEVGLISQLVSFALLPKPLSPTFSASKKALGEAVNIALNFFSPPPVFLNFN